MSQIRVSHWHFQSILGSINTGSFRPDKDVFFRLFQQLWKIITTSINMSKMKYFCVSKSKNTFTVLEFDSIYFHASQYWLVTITNIHNNKTFNFNDPIWLKRKTCFSHFHLNVHCRIIIKRISFTCWAMLNLIIEIPVNHNFI